MVALISIDSRILETLARRGGISELTELQRDVFPVILSGENALILSPTGSGKTEAALVPVLQRILEQPGEPVQVIYVTPLRALNRDLMQRITGYATDLGLRVQVRHSDITEADRREIARNRRTS